MVITLAVLHGHYLRLKAQGSRKSQILIMRYCFCLTPYALRLAPGTLSRPNDLLTAQRSDGEANDLGAVPLCAQTKVGVLWARMHY